MAISNVLKLVGDFDPAKGVLDEGFGQVNELMQAHLDRQHPYKTFIGVDKEKLKTLAMGIRTHNLKKQSTDRKVEQAMFRYLLSGLFENLHLDNYDYDYDYGALYALYTSNEAPFKATPILVVLFDGVKGEDYALLFNNAVHALKMFNGDEKRNTILLFTNIAPEKRGVALHDFEQVYGIIRNIACGPKHNKLRWKILKEILLNRADSAKNFKECAEEILQQFYKENIPYPVDVQAALQFIEALLKTSTDEAAQAFRLVNNVQSTERTVLYRSMKEIVEQKRVYKLDEWLTISGIKFGVNGWQFMSKIICFYNTDPDASLTFYEWENPVEAAKGTEDPNKRHMLYTYLLADVVPIRKENIDTKALYEVYEKDEKFIRTQFENNPRLITLLKRVCPEEYGPILRSVAWAGEGLITAIVQNVPESRCDLLDILQVVVNKDNLYDCVLILYQFKALRLSPAGHLASVIAWVSGLGDPFIDRLRFLKSLSKYSPEEIQRRVQLMNSMSTIDKEKLIGFFETATAGELAYLREHAVGKPQQVQESVFLQCTIVHKNVLRVHESLQPILRSVLESIVFATNRDPSRLSELDVNFAKIGAGDLIHVLNMVKSLLPHVSEGEIIDNHRTAYEIAKKYPPLAQRDVFSIVIVWFSSLLFLNGQLLKEYLKEKVLPLPILREASPGVMNHFNDAGKIEHLKCVILRHIEQQFGDVWPKVASFVDPVDFFIWMKRVAPQHQAGVLALFEAEPLILNNSNLHRLAQLVDIVLTHWQATLPIILTRPTLYHYFLNHYFGRVQASFENFDTSSLSVETQSSLIPFMVPKKIVQVMAEVNILPNYQNEVMLEWPLSHLASMAKHYPQRILPHLPEMEDIQLAATLPFIPEEDILQMDFTLKRAAAMVCRAPLSLKKKMLLKMEVLPAAIPQGDLSGLDIQYDRFEQKCLFGEVDEDLRQMLKEFKAKRKRLWENFHVVEIPEVHPVEFLDPITHQLMEHPVFLPLSQKWVDRTTIIRFNNVDPFNMQPLGDYAVDEVMLRRIRDYVTSR